MSTRPTRNAPPPPPATNALYCHTCGRIITPRKPPTSKTPSTPQKYCSDRCRRSKPRLSTTGTSLETLIERTFVRLLSEKSFVQCGEVEREVFGHRDAGAGSSLEEEEMKMEAERDDNEEDDDDDGGVPLPLPLPSSTSSSTSTSTPTTNIQSDGRREEGLTPQQRGVQKAKEREMVRQAARRGVAFGFEVQVEGEGEGEVVRRKVDCVRGGRVVESSFAKGEWGVRWRG